MNNSLIYSFEPIAQSNAEILVLGSMPGRESLQAQQYYAHPRNDFWTIMAEILDFDVTATYQNRAAALRSARIALWDVLHACIRRGSLDSSIETATIVVNDFPGFFLSHNNVHSVIFNGATAEQLFIKHALPRLDNKKLRYLRVPSTSPANASWSYSRKREAWRAAFDEASACHKIG